MHWCSRGKDYGEWGLHVWGAAREGTSWEAPLEPEEVDDFGAVWTVPTKTWTIGQDGETLGLLIHRGAYGAVLVQDRISNWRGG